MVHFKFGLGHLEPSANICDGLSTWTMGSCSKPRMHVFIFERASAHNRILIRSRRYVVFLDLQRIYVVGTADMPYSNTFDQLQLGVAQSVQFTVRFMLTAFLPVSGLYYPVK